RQLLALHARARPPSAAVRGVCEVPLASRPDLRPLSVRRFRVVAAQRPGDGALMDDVPPGLLPGVSAAPHGRCAGADRGAPVYLLSRGPPAGRVARRHDAGAPVGGWIRPVRGLQLAGVRPVRVGRLKSAAHRAPSFAAAETLRALFTATLYCVSMAPLLLRRGLVGGRRQDIAIRDGRIRRIGDDLDPSGHEAIDVTDRLVLPGFIETHIHPDKAVIADRTRGLTAGGAAPPAPPGGQEKARAAGGAGRRRPGPA